MKLKSVESTWHPAPWPSANLMIIIQGNENYRHCLTALPEQLNLPTLNFIFLDFPDLMLPDIPIPDIPSPDLPGDGFRNGVEEPTGPAALQNSRRLLEKAVRELEENGFHRKDLFIFGYSRACLLLLEFGVRSYHVYRGFICVSGCRHDVDLLLEYITPQARHGNWLITHGNQDNASPPQPIRDQVETLMAGGLPIHYVEFLKGRCIEPVGEIPLIRQWILRRM